MPGPRNPSAWPLRNRRLWGRLAATAHAFGRRALAVRGARRQLHNSRGAGDPLARFASRTHVRQVPEGALPPCLRHVLAVWNVFGSPIGLSQTMGRRTINSGLTALRKEADGMGRDQAASGPIAALRTTDGRYTSVVWELRARPEIKLPKVTHVPQNVRLCANTPTPILREFWPCTGRSVAKEWGADRLSVNGETHGSSYTQRI